jgi:hypothetical protein
MTPLPMHVEARAPEDPVHAPGQSGAHDIVTRLRDAAAQMVPFSGTRTLLREAAATIEQLDGLARRHVTEAAHLAAEARRAQSCTTTLSRE